MSTALSSYTSSTSHNCKFTIERVSAANSSSRSTLLIHPWMYVKKSSFSKFFPQLDWIWQRFSSQLFSVNGRGFAALSRLCTLILQTKKSLIHHLHTYLNPVWATLPWVLPDMCLATNLKIVIFNGEMVFNRLLGNGLSKLNDFFGRPPWISSSMKCAQFLQIWPR